MEDYVKLEWTEDYKLKYEDNSINSMLSANILEKYPFEQAKEVLKEYFRVIAPNGSLEIWVTNFDRMLYDMNNDKWNHLKTLANINKLIYSNLSLHTPFLVLRLLHEVGFKRVESLNTHKFNDYSFGLKAYKEGSNADLPEVGY